MTCEDGIPPVAATLVGEALEAQQNPLRVQKQLKFNSVGLAVGLGAGQAANKLGSLVRSNIPLRFKTWKKVPSGRKDTVWIELQGHYNYTNAQRGPIMRKAGAAWRRYKSTLRLRLRGDDIQRWIEAMPLKGVKPEDWMIFCQNENSPEQRAIRRRNLIMKRNCVRKSTHNTGRHGYAQAEQNFKDENQGRNPLRVELWLYTHKKKGGGYSPHNIQFATKLEGLLAIMRENGTVETLDSGPLFDTFGVEKGGSTRCVGSTISRTALMASSFAQQMLAEVDLERVEWREEMKSLRADNQQVISQMKELTEGLKNGRYSNCGPTQIIPSNIPASVPSFNPGSSQLFQWIPCRILSHTGVIVAHGSKAPLGSTHSVNGHVMLPREAKVLIDEVTDFTYPVFGGLQDGAKTLGEVSSGTILYWHDDYLPLED